MVEASPRIPWAKVAGMRNRLIHAYFDIDFDILWETVVTAVPALATETTGIIRVIYLRPSPAPERFNKKASQTLTNRVRSGGGCDSQVRPRCACGSSA